MLLEPWFQYWNARTSRGLRFESVVSWHPLGDGDLVRELHDVEEPEVSECKGLAADPATKTARLTPSQWKPLERQFRHSGFVSSHLTLRCLQVAHPNFDRPLLTLLMAVMVDKAGVEVVYQEPTKATERCCAND